MKLLEIFYCRVQGTVASSMLFVCFSHALKKQWTPKVDEEFSFRRDSDYVFIFGCRRPPLFSDIF
jgi:hypothetical protein